MKTVIIVSKCLRVTKFSSHESDYEFHFKGVCAGEVLRKIILRGSHDCGVKKGEEYLIYLKMISFEGGTLKGVILKVKLIDECWDRS